MGTSIRTGHDLLNALMHPDVLHKDLDKPVYIRIMMVEAGEPKAVMCRFVPQEITFDIVDEDILRVNNGEGIDITVYQGESLIDPAAVKEYMTQEDYDRDEAEEEAEYAEPDEEKPILLTPFMVADEDQPALVKPRMLRYVRKAAGFDIFEMAKIMGLESEMITAVERGNSRITFHAATAWAAACKVPLGYLYLQSPPERSSWLRRQFNKLFR